MNHTPTEAQRKEAEQYMRSSVWASHIVVSGAAPGIYLAALQGPAVQKLVEALEMLVADQEWLTEPRLLNWKDAYQCRIAEAALALKEFRGDG